MGLIMYTGRSKQKEKVGADFITLIQRAKLYEVAVV